MKRYQSSIALIALVFLIIGNRCSQQNSDDKYQPLGIVIMTTNGLLMVKYPQGIPDNVSDTEYKELLKVNYNSFYEMLLPYQLKIKKKDKAFFVSVFDGKTLVLTDWSCTEDRIDCWNYNGQCNPDKLYTPCNY